MKIDRLETHDRLQYLLNDQNNTIAQGAEDCLKKNPLSLKFQEHSHYVYIFAHPRISDDKTYTRMLWQPRLTKPSAQTNSYLFRAFSKSDLLSICWLIPPRELWKQYRKGNMTEQETVMWSINEFLYNRDKLESPEPDDLHDEKIAFIYRQIEREKLYDKLYLTNEDHTNDQTHNI
jgi:hypothetical protein